VRGRATEMGRCAAILSSFGTRGASIGLPVDDGSAKSCDSSREMRAFFAIGAVFAISTALAGVISGACKMDTHTPPPPLPNYVEMPDPELRKQASNDNHDAEYEMGRRAYGRDNAEALKWFCRAADASHPAARYALGLLYEPGRTPPVRDQSYARAYMWLSFAAAAGVADALKEKRRLGELMTAEQIEEGRRMIATWQPGNCGAAG
jgi:hypothetical protein